MAPVKLMVDDSSNIETVAIVPLTPGEIESFHRALDLVARDRKYLSMLEAPKPFNS